MTQTMSRIHAHLISWERLPLTVVIDNYQLHAEPLDNGSWHVNSMVDGQVRYECLMSTSRLEDAIARVMNVETRKFTVTRECDNNGYCIGVLCYVQPAEVHVNTSKTTSIIGNFLKKLVG